MRYHHYLRQSTYRRYGIFVLTIFFGFYSIQAYVNNIGIEQSIEQVRSEINEMEQRTDYLTKFYSPYLESEYAAFFLGHENGMIYEGERIVKLKHQVDTPEETTPKSIEQEESIKLSTPEESRHYFIDTKLSTLKELGILQ